ncbi:MAG: EamA family transporter [Pseudomonadota bacterium]
MDLSAGLKQPGVLAALGAALLFGAGTPVAKLLLQGLNPWLLAGLLYLGSGLGMTLYRRISGATSVRLSKSDMPWFAGAIFSGGVVAPVLLMFGLSGMPAAGASLLLNAEGVFTALLAWFAFKENFDRRIALGMVAILAGAVILSWPSELHLAALWPALAVLAACFAWGLDNNLTRKVSLTDASWIAAVKGLVAGSVNLLLALWLGSALPAALQLASALLLGFFAYGLSLALFVVALRHLGTARTGAYFSVAPFFGALLAVAMGEVWTSSLLIAGGLMALGVLLHLTEQHRHAHSHEPIEHEHAHIHDEHHQHEHADGLAVEGHSHRHLHTALRHDHAHYPDAHHRHGH